MATDGMVEVKSGRQVVLITGSTGGLGQAVARAFAAAGARLFLTDRTLDRLEAQRSELGLDAGRCALHVCDITRRSDAQGLGAAVEAAFGQLDVAIHLAGGFKMGPVHETPEETWNFLFDLNARSVANLAAGIVPTMLRQGRGAIVHVGARPALQGAAGVGVYAASKAAVLRLTESMAAELLDKGIRVNSVLPSTIDTPANRQAMPGMDPGRWVTPESIAEVLLFLASPAARDISGAAIPVYGRA